MGFWFLEAREYFLFGTGGGRGVYSVQLSDTVNASDGWSETFSYTCGRGHNLLENVSTLGQSVYQSISDVKMDEKNKLDTKRC